ncbi:TPA: calcium-binding protein, partial [Neisseria meningitidis]
VWQDLNQDGISQTNELRTLEELGIQSLDFAYKDVNKNLGKESKPQSAVLAIHTPFVCFLGNLKGIICTRHNPILYFTKN